jgi:hypothetical protein
VSALVLCLALLFPHGAVYAGTNVGVSWGCDSNGEHGSTLEVIGVPGVSLDNTEC